MRIAFDGGSFQQGILGGIHSVAVNFLNACRRRDPSFDVTLVLDPRLGPINPTAISQLSWTPKTASAPVGPAYHAMDFAPADSSDPGVRLFVDGDTFDPEQGQDSVVYRGVRPDREFVILSRSARPSEALQGSSDIRKLGIAITDIVLSDGSETRRIAFNDRRLHRGYHAAEATFRWTDGSAFVPVEFFSGLGDEITVEISYKRLPSYPLAPGRFNERVQAFRRELQRLTLDNTTDQLAAGLKADGCEIYFTNHFIPARMTQLKRVAWAYDLIPVLFPQHFHPDARENFDANVDVFRAADRVYTISHSTLDDLANTLHVDRDRLRYAGIAADVNIGHRKPDEVKKVLKARGLDKSKYMIMVSTVEPRKNHLRLLMAYDDLRKRLPDCPKLVMVGQMGWDFQEALNFRDTHGLTADALMLSNLSTHELSCLYTGALFSVYPSVYEGFGLPILESMQCGTPVMTSNTSSMAEIAADAALTVDPYSVEDISNGLYRLSTDAAMRADLVAKGDRRRQDYSWDRTAQIILDDLRSLTS